MLIVFLLLSGRFHNNYPAASAAELVEEILQGGGSFDDVMSPQWEEAKIFVHFLNFYISIVNSCDDEKSEKRILMT